MLLSCTKTYTSSLASSGLSLNLRTWWTVYNLILSIIFFSSHKFYIIIILNFRFFSLCVRSSPNSMTLCACMLITLPIMLWLVFYLMPLQYFKQRFKDCILWLFGFSTSCCSSVLYPLPFFFLINFSFGNFLAWFFYSSISVCSVCVQLFMTSMNCSHQGSSLHGILHARILD